MSYSLLNNGCFERLRFYYEIPIKKQMIKCNAYINENENLKAFLCLDRILGYLDYNTMKQLQDEMIELEEMSHKRNYHEVANLYERIKEKLDNLGFPWPMSMKCRLTERGLEIV